MTERMLIIDDEEVVLESCQKIFTAEGFETFERLSLHKKPRLFQINNSLGDSLI